MIPFSIAHSIRLDAVQKYTAANGAVFDEDVGLYRLTPAQFASLKSLFFTIHGVRTHQRDSPH